MRRLLLHSSIVLISLSLSAMTADAQQPAAPEPKPAPATNPQAAPAANPPAADRLRAAKNIFLKRSGGSDIPYNVINSGFEGWGRYVLVDSPDNADIVMEISAPPDDNGTKVTAKTSRETGMPESGYSSSKDFSNDPIKITVYEAKSKRPLWSATDKPKFAMKQKAKENNLVESAERLFARFHDRIEPALGLPKLP